MLVPAMIGVISAAVFLLFTTFVVPPFLSLTSQILQPTTVKRGWDSINVVLVLFAIICGVLARQNDDGSSSSYSHGEEGAAIGETVGDDVYDADRLKIYESLSRLPVTGGLPLRRSSSSYPDLRNGVYRETVDRRFRFYDDLEIHKYRSESTVVIDERFQSRSKPEVEESEPKEITVDKFVVRPSSPPPQQPPAPPPNPPPLRRTHRSVRNRDMQEKSKRSDAISDSTRFKRTLRPPPPSPPPPPPPPRKLQRRKSNAAKEIKMVFASLYNQGKRKKKQKRKERSESPAVAEMEPPQYRSSIPPPPPPPPPPPQRSPQSVFYGLFKKGVKSKKIHSIPAPPPPPPPPRKIQSDPQTPPRRVNCIRPPRPTKQANLNEESYQGSPLTQTTPPPPPPPPFRVPPLKFVVSGDFAKIRSNQSSRCSSPEREVIDLGWGLELTQSDGGEESSVAENGGGSGNGMGFFCPSPDVNAKADNFIARLRDEWRLDKVNSVKRRRSMSSV
ncbi:hypothetical protein Bca4012_025267 [Brassica carinata]